MLVNYKSHLLNCFFSQYFKITIIFLLLVNGLHAQDFHKVDSIIGNYPKSFSNSQKLANKICTDFNRPEERTYAIYAWIAKNIEYDVNELFSKKKSKGFTYTSIEDKREKELEYNKKVIKHTLKKGKAVCEGYSLLFKDLCDLCEIQCEVINGGVKTDAQHIGKRPSSKHAWNAVKINSSWKLIDVTWGAGTVNYKRKVFQPDYTDSYFFTEPDLFFLKHFPNDTAWILTDKTKQDFIDLPLYYEGYFKSDFEFVTPLKGVLTIKKNEMIDFEILNISKSYFVEYSFTRDKNFYSIEPDIRKENYCKFQIKNKLTRNGYLTLFIDHKSVVVYKILIEK